MVKTALEAGKTYRVGFKAKNFAQLVGYQFALHFDPQLLQLEDIEAGELANLTEANFGLTMLDAGMITTSWDHSPAHYENAVLFTLVFKASGKAPLSEALRIASASIPAEAYHSEGGLEMELRGVKLQFSNATSLENGFELFQNKPNPFDGETAIGFNLSESGKASLDRLRHGWQGAYRGLGPV